MRVHGSSAGAHADEAAAGRRVLGVERALGQRQRLGRRRSGQHASVEVDHHPASRDVVDGAETGNDDAGAESEQRGGQALEFVAGVDHRQAAVAGRQHEQVRGLAQGGQVVDGHRAVDELQVREERVVRAEDAVAGDVRGRGAVERGQDVGDAGSAAG